MVVVQSLNRVQLLVTPWTTAHQASLTFTTSRSLFRFMSIESVMLSNHLFFCYPFSFCPQFLSAFRIRWPKYWSFSFSISPSSKYSGLISFQIDWLDLLAVQGTLKSLLQHHSSKINSLLLSFLYGPSLTCIHDCWKTHSFD